jgi:UDP-GlcNAc:undecaprenyl-phosphate GlcNAc-1-phosphate transferase
LPSDPITMAFVFLVTLAVSLALTPVVRRISMKRGLVDEPGEERRVHRVPVPRLGGLAMYAAFLVGVLAMFAVGVENDYLNGSTPGNGRFEPIRILVVLAGAGMITLVMAEDDIRGIKHIPRLLWQKGAAAIVVEPSRNWPGGPNPLPPPAVGTEPAGTIHYDQGAGVIATSVRSPFGGVTIQLPLILAVLFAIIWIVGVTNTINWIDGLDGLAAGVSLVACVVLFVITGPVLGQFTLSYLPLALAAAILGFLPYNIHPARIFMGDSGAMFLGFMLAVLSIIGGAKLASALLVLGIPVLDAVYIIIYRLLRRRSPLLADRSHLHHRLLDIGFSQQQVVLLFYLLCSAFGLLAFLLTALSSSLYKFFALILLAVVLLGLLIFIARRRLDPARRGDQSPGIERPTGNPQP